MRKLLYWQNQGEESIDEVVVAVPEDFDFDYVKGQIVEAIGGDPYLAATVPLPSQLDEMADYRLFIG